LAAELMIGQVSTPLYPFNSCQQKPSRQI